MKSNFSNTEIRMNFIHNKKLFASILFSLLANGCSEFYGYQPPAPIYGNRQASNPYEDQPTVITRPIEEVDRNSGQQSTFEEYSPSGLSRETTPLEPLPGKADSPAVLALITEADRSSQSGDLESAVSTIERALRIDPRNPRLTYKLAVLRLKQSKPRLAEDLAKKAALLSANDRWLKRQSWLLISEARKQQQNYHGAKEARLKADNI